MYRLISHFNTSRTGRSLSTSSLPISINSSNLSLFQPRNFSIFINPPTLVEASPNVFSTLISSPMSLHPRAISRSYLVTTRIIPISSLLNNIPSVCPTKRKSRSAGDRGLLQACPGTPIPGPVPHLPDLSDRGQAYGTFFAGRAANRRPGNLVINQNTVGRIDPTP